MHHFSRTGPFEGLVLLVIQSTEVPKCKDKTNNLFTS